MAAVPGLPRSRLPVPPRLAPLYLGPFIGGWTLLKFAIGWLRTPLNAEVALGSQLAMIGNVLSFAIALAGGWWLKSGNLAFFTH
jgi:hypothetical protein